MNTQLNVKTRRQVFSPRFVTLLIGVVLGLAMLALGGSSVQAQTSTATATDTTTQATVDSSITLTAKGSLTDPQGSLTVTGNVIISCRRVVDTTSATTPTLVLLDFDFSQLTGTSGKKVYVTGGNHTIEIRPMQATDTIIVTVPYFENTKDVLTARSMLATTTLNFDLGTGKLTSGSITVGNNVVTAAAVGTTSTTPQ